MSASEASLGDYMIAARAIHFAATAIMVGALLFRAVVAVRAANVAPAAERVVASRVRWVAWISFVISAVTGLIWVLLQTMSITGVSLSEVLTSDALATVVEETQFGQVAIVRNMLAVVVAVCLAGERVALLRRLALPAALGFEAAIAWTGHAGSTAGDLGILHLASDVLHLWAAAAWTGGLVLLVLVLITGRRHGGTAWNKFELDVVRRFSTLGIVSVATLALSGTINAWIIVQTWQALVGTAYGELLLFKIAVVGAMVAFAGVNRLWLTPQLASSGTSGPDASPQLARNAVIEIALGLIVFAIVGALGLQHPMVHP